MVNSLFRTFQKHILVVLPLLLAGCASHFPDKQQQPGSQEWSPPEIDYSLPAAKHGSAYRPGFLLTLFNDKRAFRQGDILTVSLNERTQASKSAGTRTAKDSGLNLGAQVSGDNTSFNGSANLNSGKSFNGNGSSSQRNQLTGSITVTVAKVYPNGTLLIKGEKWLRLNQGDEFIRVWGMVRTDDIGNDNTISSQRIADARIIYGGQGALADSNAQGWASRFFNSPWFPM